MTDTASHLSRGPHHGSLRPGTRLLSRTEVAALLDLDDCIAAVEDAFLAHAGGRAIPPGVLGVHVEGGGFHLKTAGLLGAAPRFAAKLNGNFHGNAERFGLPRIQGLVILCDALNGYPLSVMDSTEITVLRTAAATAVAAKHLARAGSTTVTICGCGLQGRAHLKALRRVRALETAYAFDVDPAVAERFAAELAGELALEVVPTGDLARACRRSEICVTCTPSRQPLLRPGDIPLGAFIAAVGADSEEKQELDPELFRSARVVVDHLGQCATIGELHHALVAGIVATSDVAAELHEVVSGAKPGRLSDDEVVIFDSTGVALEDVAAAALVFERAREAGVGTVLELL